MNIHNQNNNSYEDKNQKYECINAGCPHGQGHMFDAAPEEWFLGQGWPTPCNCDYCGGWVKGNKADGDFEATCSECTTSWTITVEYRFRYYRQEGCWDTYWEQNKYRMLCNRCTNNPRRLAKAAARVYTELLKESQEERERHPFFAQFRISVTTHVEREGYNKNVPSINVPHTVEFYSNLVNRGEQQMRHGQNELVHITKPDHDLSTLGSENPSVQIQILADLAACTDPHVIACKSGDNIIKVDMETGLVVILTEWHMPTGEWRIRTGYVADDFDQYLLDMTTPKKRNKTTGEREAAWVPLTDA